MKIVMRRILLALMTAAILSIAAGAAAAQTDTVAKKRLRIPATTTGVIGGESHDSYVIRMTKGRKMTIQISWKKVKDNRAEFTLSSSDNFFGAEQVTFGETANGGKTWTGKIPETGDYYIYVVAHPSAKYKLRVTIE